MRLTTQKTETERQGGDEDGKIWKRGEGGGERAASEVVVTTGYTFGEEETFNSMLRCCKQGRQTRRQQST